MSFDFLDLLWEIQEKVYSYCVVSDLRNIACCSSAHYNSVAYFLWHKVKIPWNAVERKSIVVSKNLKLLKYTTSLCFAGNSDSFGDEIRAFKVADNINLIIKNCNPSQLILSSTHMFHCVDAVEQMFLGFVNLHELSITKLQLSGALQSIDGLHFLEKLYIEDCLVKDDDIRKVGKLMTLKEVVLTGESLITGESFEYLSNLIELRKMVVNGIPNVESYAYTHIVKLVKLRELRLENTRIDDTTFECLCNHLGNLETLSIMGSKELTDAGIHHVTKLKSLNTLVASKSILSDRSFMSIGKLQQLRNLDLNSIHVTDNGICNIQNLTSLEYLNLCSTKISDAGISYLARFNKLNEINLSSTGISDESMLLLSFIPSITKLYLGYTPVTDVGLSHISKLPSLTVLTMNNTLITDAGVMYLKTCLCLKVLDTRFSNATREGLHELLSFPNLKGLEIGGLHYY